MSGENSHKEPPDERTRRELAAVGGAGPGSAAGALELRRAVLLPYKDV